MNNQRLEALASLASAAGGDSSDGGAATAAAAASVGARQPSEAAASSSVAGDRASSAVGGNNNNNSGIAGQQLQQLIAAASAAANAAGNSQPQPQHTSAMSALLQQSQHQSSPSRNLLNGVQQQLLSQQMQQQSQQQQQQPQQDALLALQQLAYCQMLARGKAAQQQQQAAQAPAAATTVFDTSNAAQLLQLNSQLSQLKSSMEDKATRPQVLSQALGGVASTQASGQTKMTPPPPPPSSQPTLATLNPRIPTSPPGGARGAPVPAQPQSSLTPAQPTLGSAVTVSTDDASSAPFDHRLVDKKMQKRAANRRSAQLSRKRKKVFMEELKEENDELRRKELILRSIPDLIVVFDSTGKLLFVSHSVSRFLQYTAEELEGTSLWDRLCEDSVRLLKAAFMDSLAARQADSETAPLGCGFWQLRLVDKDETQKVVTVNGVVHFAGDRPECVCSIRPSSIEAYNTGKDEEDVDEEVAEVSDSINKKKKQKKDNHHRCLIHVHPQQSVVCSGSSGSDSSNGHRKKKVRRGNGNMGGGNRETFRISDSGNSSGGNSSGESETASGSGSSDD